MKNKIFSLLLCAVMALLTLSSCQALLPKSVVGTSLNENGELILTFSDNTTQNLGVVKGADGNDGNDGKDGIDGSDGKDFSPCSHIYQDWQTVLSPSCTSIGYNTRSCSLCGDLDYQFTQALGHTYENPTYVIGTPCQPSWINKTCTSCGDTILIEEPASEEHSYSDWETIQEYACGTSIQQRTCLYCGEIQTQTINGEHTFGDWETVKEASCIAGEKQRVCKYCDLVETEEISALNDFFAHSFDENGVCSSCGDVTDFIESEEYIEKCVAGYPSTFIYYLWWNKDKTYQLQLCPININSPTCEFDVTYLHRSNDQPKKIILPSHFYGNKIVSLGDYRSSGGFHHLSVEEIIIPETIKVVQKYVFQDCTNLKKVTFLGNDLVTIERGAFLGCTELTEITLPSSLKNLDLMSFSQCPNLKNINISTETNVINAGESSVPNISTIKYYN